MERKGLKGWFATLFRTKNGTNGDVPSFVNPVYLWQNTITGQKKTLPNSFLYSCLKLRAGAVAQLKWNVYEESENGELIPVPLDNAIAYSFWQPNQNLTNSELIQNIVFNLDYFGNAFVLVEKTPSKFNLYPLNPDLIQVKYISDSFIYVYNGKEFSKSEVIHFRQPLLQNDIFGIQPRNVIKQDVETLNALNSFIERFVESKGVPPIYFSGAQLTEQQKRNAVQEWNQSYPDFPLRLFISEGELKSIPISISFNTDRIPEIVKLLQTNISSFYQIPLGKLTGDNANYATAFINDFTFWQNSIKPTAQLIADKFTDYFRQFSPKILFAFQEMDFSAIEIFKEKPNPEIVQKSTQVAFPKELAYFTWKAIDEITEVNEKEYLQAYKETLEELQNAVQRNVAEQRTYGEAIEITKQQLKELLLAGFGKKFEKHIKKALDYAFNSIGEKPITGFEELLFELKLQAINQTEIWLAPLFDKLSVELTGVPELEKAKEKIAEIFVKAGSNLKTKASTLSAYITNASFQNVYLQVQDKYDKVWLSQRDNRVRPSHILADGQIAKNGMFTVGGELMPHPCGGVVPSNNINCRCYIIFRKKQQQ